MKRAEIQLGETYWIGSDHNGFYGLVVDLGPFYRDPHYFSNSTIKVYYQGIDYSTWGYLRATDSRPGSMIAVLPVNMSGEILGEHVLVRSPGTFRMSMADHRAQQEKEKLFREAAKKKLVEREAALVEQLDVACSGLPEEIRSGLKLDVSRSTVTVGLDTFQKLVEYLKTG